MAKVSKVDFHCHTISSKDSLTPPEELVRIARKKQLNHIVVTDHNSIAGALAAYHLDPEMVITGEEIKTTRGEILAAYVKEEIPPDLTPLETIKRLREQEAFISISHPFDSWRNGAWKREDLLEIIPFIDAIEVFNARCSNVADNQRAMEFAREQHIPGTAGSDAHTAFEVGAALLELPPFDNPVELRKVIRLGKVEGKLSPFWVHFASYYARWRKMVV